MRHRIRCAVILVQGLKILLVKHLDAVHGEVFWVPPGGGLEDQDESIFGCAAREVFEETGLQVTPGRLVYLREFMDGASNTRNLELFFLGLSYSGELTLANAAGRRLDEDTILEAAWLSRDELQGLTVYPKELKKEFWEESTSGLTGVRYLAG